MDSPRPPAGPPLPPEPPPAGPPLPQNPAPAGAGAPPPPARPASPLADVAPESRQLPPHQGKVARVTSHVASLSADLREWVELRIDLLKAEVQEKIEAVKASLRRKGIAIALLLAAGVLALYALGFLLGALAWALGGLFGHAAWGFLAVAVLLFVIVGVLAWLGKRKLDEDKAIEARAKVPDIKESQEAHPAPPSRIQLQDLEAQKARAATT